MEESSTANCEHPKCNRVTFRNTTRCYEHQDFEEIERAELEKKKEEEEIHRIELEERLRISTEVKASTGNYSGDYEIIAPVFFQLTNKGIYSTLKQYKKQYVPFFESFGYDRDKSKKYSIDLLFFLAPEIYSGAENDFEIAYYIGIEELKLLADGLGGDAVLFIKHDIDLDTRGWTHFSLQVTGTAVKLLETSKDD